MKNLLWAILLVLIGFVFPGAWILVGPMLVLLIIGAVLESFIEPIGQLLGLNRSVTSQEFQAEQDELFVCLVRIISSLGYKMEDANKDTGLITFKTRPSINTLSGHIGSVIITPLESGTCNVQITMSTKGQLLDLGEGKRIAQRIINKLNEAIKNVE